MPDFKRYDSDSDQTSNSIDGFTSKRKSTNGFQKSNRVNNLDFTPSKKTINIDDHSSFPGLKSTFQQPTIHLEDDTYQAPKKKKGLLKAPKIRPIKLFRRLAIISIVLVMVVGSWLAVKGYLTARKVFNGDGTAAVALNRNIDPTQLNSEGDGRVNILLLGKAVTLTKVASLQTRSSWQVSIPLKNRLHF